MTFVLPLARVHPLLVVQKICILWNKSYCAQYDSKARNHDWRGARRRVVDWERPKKKTASSPFKPAWRNELHRAIPFHTLLRSKPLRMVQPLFWLHILDHVAIEIIAVQVNRVHSTKPDL